MYQALYFADTYQFAATTTLMASRQDERGPYIILEQTPFYPQGGGQPCDQGQINLASTILQIDFVRQVAGEIRHYLAASAASSNEGLLVGQSVHCTLDAHRRIRHAKLHSAGHLLSHILTREYPQCRAIKGHHYPGECYVEFQISGHLPEKIAIDTLNHQLKTSIAEKQAIEAFLSVLSKSVET